jgi:hypothetical protein
LKALLIAMLVVSTPVAALETLPEYAGDFADAKECRPLDDGRRLWAGSQAFYISSWMFKTGDSGLIDPDNVGVVEGGPEEHPDLAALCPH